jgi:5'-nucleotidase
MKAGTAAGTTTGSAGAGVGAGSPASAALHAATTTTTIRLLHFNDVYNIEERSAEPRAGAARFVTALRAHALPPPTITTTTCCGDPVEKGQQQQQQQQQQVQPQMPGAHGPAAGAAAAAAGASPSAAPGADSIVLFSGDCLSPSSLSHVTKGAHMPPVLGPAGADVDVACIGNHDLDFGIDNLRMRMAESGFPWLCSNAHSTHDGQPLAGARETHVVERRGFRIGLLGIVSEDWLQTLNCIDPDEVRYSDTVETADALAAQLKSKAAPNPCHMVIALTHMRGPDDLRLATHAKHVDLILGGHDHCLDVSNRVNNIWIVKSGSDFVHFTTIDVAVSPDMSFSISQPVPHQVTSAYPPDPAVAAVVERHVGILAEARNVTVGYTAVELDGSFATVRRKESALGNFIVDVVTHAMRADIGLLNSGSLRSERKHPVGAITHGDLGDILPFDDETVSVELTGSQILSALENSVSRYPAQEGRFCQVSGIMFDFDPQRPPNERIVQDSVLCRYGGELQPLDLSRRYKCATKYYMLEGKDGFDALRKSDSTDVVRNDTGHNLRAIVSNYISDFHHRHNSDKTCDGERSPYLSRQLSMRREMKRLLDSTAPIFSPGQSSDQVMMGICPAVEGRIRCISS